MQRTTHVHISVLAALLTVLGSIGLSYAQRLEHYKGSFGPFEEVVLTMRERNSNWEGRCSYTLPDGEIHVYTLSGQISTNGRFSLEELDQLGRKRQVRWEGTRSKYQLTGIWNNRAKGQKYYFTLRAYAPPRAPDHIDSIQRATERQFGVLIPRYRIFEDYLGFPVGVPCHYERLLDTAEISVVAFPAINQDTAYLHLRPEAFRMLRRLQRLAEGEVVLGVKSAFRSTHMQRKLYKKYGEQRIEKPGYSEHHLGTSVDFAEVTEESPAFLWLLQHAFSYGWVPTYYFREQDYLMRHVEHWRYVGKMTALAFREAWRVEVEERIEQLEKARRN